MNGPSAQLLVAKDLKSGLEHVLDRLGRVMERLRREKIAIWSLPNVASLQSSGEVQAVLGHKDIFVFIRSSLA